MDERLRIADFWDQAIADWINNKPMADPDLIRWQQSYHGNGDGEVDLEHYPDPVVGDLRGLIKEPRIVLLGINPGIGYDEIQSKHGIWTNRIATEGYTRCLKRSPAADPKTWLKLHGKESRYWQNVISFARKWLDDTTISIQDILNFELYPWHSKKVSGSMRPPSDLIQKYVWNAVAELKVNVVFAFAVEWFNQAEGLGLERIARYGPLGMPLNSATDMAHWHLGFYRISPNQVLVISAQKGYAGPPNQLRLEIIRGLLQKYV